MRNETRLLFTAYVSQIALLNGVADATTKFSISPAVEQKLEEKIQESSDFLSEINIVGVPQQSGDKVGVTVTRPIASRTNTRSEEHTYELQTLMRISYAVFCSKKKKS